MTEKLAKKPRLSRPFKIFLFIVLPFLVVAGVITWAASTGIPAECRRGKIPNITYICDRLWKKGNKRGFDIRTVDVPPADTKLGTDHDSELSGLDIQVTNHTDQEYFVPFRTQKELASFAQWATTEGQGKDKVSLCVKNKAVTDTTDIEGGEIIDGEYEYFAEVDGCGVEGRACTVTELRGQRCAAKANVTDWEVITQKHLAGASL